MRVALVDADEALHHAVETALSPWDMVVVSVEGPAPGATMPSSAARSAAIARDHDATAAIWISESEGGPALWIRDGRQGRVIARPLPRGPPFDAATAASVALIVKTLLLQGPVVGASARGNLRSAERPTSALTSASAMTPSASSVGTLTSTTSDLASWGPDTAAEPREWTLMTSVGARFLATAPDRAETRLALWLTSWPSALEGHLGFGVVAASGPGLAVQTPTLSAHWTATALQLTARGRLSVTDWLDLGITCTAGAHVTTLDGFLQSSGRSVSSIRVNPVVGADLELGVRLGHRLRIEARIGSVFPLRQQRYRVGDVTALELTPSSLRTLLSAELTL